WSNTSSNNIIKELVENADSEMRQEIEKLIAGGSIRKPVHEDITYDSIYDSQDNLWNFLYFTGYLKAGGENFEDDTKYMELMIPNTEVRTIYKRTILGWFDKRVEKLERTELIHALEEGDCELLEKFISEQLLETISFYDYAENYYHGFLAGLLKGNGKYLVTSNRESGKGRPDILLKTPSVRGGAIILELKVSDTFQGMEQKCRKALEQMEEMNYEAGLRAEGYCDIKKYGVCFYRKECMVRK
ncbi:MAG: PD-(D/E)XK nuclease domain-containing protein, partial [Eubacterium sp.]|nr:PD-(D/E)XK nuclease domain-containing protein [Eubacterium sp.]